MKRVYIFAVALVVFAYLPISATIINIPDDYPTIQEGIDVSSDCYTVLVNSLNVSRISIFKNKVMRRKSVF